MNENDVINFCNFNFNEIKLNRDLFFQTLNFSNRKKHEYLSYSRYSQYSKYRKISKKYSLSISWINFFKRRCMMIFRFLWFERNIIDYKIILLRSLIQISRYIRSTDWRCNFVFWVFVSFDFFNTIINLIEKRQRDFVAEIKVNKMRVWIDLKHCDIMCSKKHYILSIT